MSDEPNRSTNVSPFLVAIAAWLLPGAGYLLLRQRARGITIGVTIITLFMSGLLIGGVRCLEVPGYNAHGVKTYSYFRPAKDSRKSGYVAEVGAEPSGEDVYDSGWTFTKHPVDEIRSKPWTLAQVMMGPIDLLCDFWSIYLGQPDPAKSTGERLGARSHARVNELGILYTAVAGLLNLLAIIDSSHRAAHAEAK